MNEVIGSGGDCGELEGARPCLREQSLLLIALYENLGLIFQFLKRS